MFRRNKGQSTLEYITVFSAIVAAILVLAYTKLQPAVSSILDSAATKITNATSDFKGATVAGTTESQPSVVQQGG